MSFTYETIYLVRQCKTCNKDLNFNELKAQVEVKDPICSACTPAS